MTDWRLYTADHRQLDGGDPAEARRRIGTKPHRRADGSSRCVLSAVPANASGLPDQVCDQSAGEAHHKDGCDYHEDQVDGPRVIAFAYKVDVSSALLSR